MLRPEKGPNPARCVAQLKNDVEILSSRVDDAQQIVDKLARKT